VLNVYAVPVKPALSGKKKWSLYGGGLLIEVEVYGIDTGPSGLLIQVVTRAGFHRT
jgi:hypothetical protein